MKKLLAIALAAVMVLGLASSALAVSWAAPAASTTASPFAVEVIKLAVSSDVTGGAYYTVLDDAAAYDYSTIYYAIKLSLPSVADANAYYGNSGFHEGNSVKVSIEWTNVSGKSTKVVTVPLTSEAQTLWFDGTNFTTTWQQTLAASCGCGESHILSAVASGTKEVSIKVCVGASGKLSDVKVGGCYGVEEKKYYGIIPCVNCKPMNLKGFLFSGDCAAYKVFFATNSADKVVGAYVVDENYDDVYYGAYTNAFDKTLYGWRITGTYKSDCETGTCRTYPAFSLQKLPANAVIDETGASPVLSDAAMVAWQRNNANLTGNNWSNDSNGLIAAWNNWLTMNQAPSNVEGTNINLWTLFTYTDGTYTERTDKFVNGAQAYAEEKNNYTNATADKFQLRGDTEGSLVLKSDGSVVQSSGATVVRRDFFTGYLYTGTQYVYGDTVVYGNNEPGKRLFEQTSATTINCDTNEAAYLNTLNHLYSVLGFTYADIAAGNVYMTEKIILANFGFDTSVCDTATWGAYTAAITVAPVTEVPATGVASFAGFAMIAVAAAAAAVAKKRD